MKNFFYDSPYKRIVMRFLEIFVLSGILGVISHEEFTSFLLTTFGTAIGAMILKLIRELTEDKLEV